MMNTKYYQILGWFGVMAVLLGYFLITFQFLDSTNIWYLVLNGCGAAGIVISSVTKKDYPPVILNMVWFTIALLAIIRMGLRS